MNTNDNNTTISFDSSLEAFEQQLQAKLTAIMPEGAETVGTIMADAMESADAHFGKLFDVLRDQLKAEVEQKEALAAQIEALSQQTPAAPAVPLTVTNPSNFPDVNWVIQHRKKGSVGKLSSHNIFVMWMTHVNGSAPAGTVWATVDKKPWEALAAEYKKQKTTVGMVAAPTTMQQLQFQQQQFLMQQQMQLQMQMRMQQQSLAPTAAVPVASATPIDIPPEFIGSDGKILQAKSEYHFWLHNAMKLNGGPLKSGTWASLTVDEKKKNADEFARLLQFRSAIRA